MNYEITLYQRSERQHLQWRALVHYEQPAGPESLEPRLLDFPDRVCSCRGSNDGHCTNNGTIGSDDFHDVTLAARFNLVRPSHELLASRRQCERWRQTRV